jgi:hypothetical protein
LIKFFNQKKINLKMKTNKILKNLQKMMKINKKMSNN